MLTLQLCTLSMNAQDTKEDRFGRQVVSLKSIKKWFYWVCIRNLVEHKSLQFRSSKALLFQKLPLAVWLFPPAFSLTFQKDTNLQRDYAERWRGRRFLSLERTKMRVRVSTCASCLAIDSYHRWKKNVKKNILENWIQTNLSIEINIDALFIPCFFARHIKAGEKGRERYIFSLSIAMGLFSIIIVLICAISSTSSARIFRITNQCNQKLWFGIQGNPLIYSGGFDVDARSSKDLSVPDGWVMEEKKSLSSLEN